MFEVTDAGLIEYDALDRKGSVYCRVALSPNPIWNRGADRQQKQTHVLRWNFHHSPPVAGRLLLHRIALEPAITRLREIWDGDGGYLSWVSEKYERIN